jgi:hypothetical protein
MAMRMVLSLAHAAEKAIYPLPIQADECGYT